jgi:hypothetical protein
MGASQAVVLLLLLVMVLLVLVLVVVGSDAVGVKIHWLDNEASYD